MSKSHGHKNLHGIFFMLINSFATSMLYVIIKYLSKDIANNQIVFLYKLAVLIGITPWVITGGITCLKTNRIRLHLIRGFLSTSAILLFVHGLVRVDIANALALNKVEPVILLLISVVYFKERLSLIKISTIFFSFLGMLFVTYPLIIYDSTGLSLPWLGMQGDGLVFNYNYLFIIAGVSLWALNSSVVKVLGKTESNRTQMFYISLISVLVSLPAAMFKWDFQSVSGFTIPNVTAVLSFSDIGLNQHHLLLIAIAAMLHFMHVAGNFLAFKVAEMSVVIPFDYSKVIFGGILGYCFFDSVPGLSSYVGYVFILASGVCLLRSEANVRKRAKIIANQLSEQDSL